MSETVSAEQPTPNDPKDVCWEQTYTATIAAGSEIPESERVVAKAISTHGMQVRDVIAVIAVEDQEDDDVMHQMHYVHLLVRSTSSRRRSIDARCFYFEKTFSHSWRGHYGEMYREAYERLKKLYSTKHGCGQQLIKYVVLDGHVRRTVLQECEKCQTKFGTNFGRKVQFHGTCTQGRPLRRRRVVAHNEGDIRRSTERTRLSASAEFKEAMRAFSYEEFPGKSTIP